MISSVNKRKCAPDNIRYIWTSIKNPKNAPVSIAKILKFMVNEGEYATDEANEVLQAAIHDLILLPASVTPSDVGKNVKNNKENALYRLPELHEIQTTHTHDLYCFECHKPGNLKACAECSRAFHLECRRNDIPNDETSVRIPSSFSLPLEDVNGSIDNTSNNNLELEDDKLTNVNCRENSVELKPHMKFESQDVKEIADVIYIGQIRSPRRRKSISSYKYENTNIDDDENVESDGNLCTCCQLLKQAKIVDPPNISKTDVSHLLQFTFDRIASWISSDTFSVISQSKSLTMPTTHEMKLFSKLCLKSPKTLDDIQSKIKHNKYSFLSEFLVDFLDIQHCIGMLYGTYSSEFEATKYQISDCKYELSEIRQCRDCYRHSNEKLTDDWFCKPCVPRHELVYAKQSRYPFWPAKVISFKNNRYDVRFFGGAHARALIHEKFVKAIDTDMKMKKMSASLQKAMDELQTHQAYFLQSTGLFSYESQQLNSSVNQIQSLVNIQNSDIAEKTNSKSKKKFKQNSAINSATKSNLKVRSKDIPETGTPLLIEEKLETCIPPSALKRIHDDTVDTHNRSKRNKSHGTNNIEPAHLDNSGKKLTKISKLRKSYFQVVKNLGREMEKAQTRAIAQKIAQETLQAEISHWKLKVDNLSKEIVETKRNSWCTWCLKSAIYHCCWNNAYCSLECQNRHWHNEHKKLCKRIRDK